MDIKIKDISIREAKLFAEGEVYLSEVEGYDIELLIKGVEVSMFIKSDTHLTLDEVTDKVKNIFEIN